MSLKPLQVIAAMREYYEQYPACAGRSIHKLGEEASNAYSAARAKFADFINTAEPEECIWTRNATESLNMVASSVKIPKGSKIVTTTLEHHSGSLPFVERARRDGLKIEIVEAKDDGTEIVEIAHDRGALVMSDDAQYAPHHPLDVQDLDVDFSAISVHKMCGPTGVGVLYGKMDLLKSMDMFLVGGDTVADVRYVDGKIVPEYLPPPEKFEAGLQNYAGAIGAGAAADYLLSIGMHNIELHERNLLSFMLKSLKEMDEVTIFGTDDIHIKTGLVAFMVSTVNTAHDVAGYLSDSYGVMLRSGAHCTHPYHYQMGIPPSKGTNRASVYLYNNRTDVEAFIEGLHALIEASS
jgi:cysteine desulfurase/selenocysteine lyase